MNNCIRIKIPVELKNKFEGDRCYLENLHFGKRRAEKLKFFLDNDMVVEALELINEITDSSHEYIQNIGFYEDFKKWLNFSLKELMKTFKIDISNSKERDIYLALYQSEMQLKENEDNTLENIIERAKYFVNKQRIGVCYNPDIYNMCDLFVRIGLKVIDIDTLVDLSYENYIRKTKKVFGIPYEEFYNLSINMDKSQNNNLAKIKKLRKVYDKSHPRAK